LLSSSSHLNFICFIDSLKHQFNTFKVHGQTQLLTYEGMITVHDLYGESRWLTAGVTGAGAGDGEAVQPEKGQGAGKCS
jgi:hypothetical protein